MNGSFQIETHGFDTGLIVDMTGDLTKAAEDTLLDMQFWNQRLCDGKKHLVLNFSGVPYINSAGIAVLIRLTRHVVKSGCTTFAYGLGAHYQKLFRMVGLTEYMMIYPDEHSVLLRIEDLNK